MLLFCFLSSVSKLLFLHFYRYNILFEFNVSTFINIMYKDCKITLHILSNIKKRSKNLEKVYVNISWDLGNLSFLVSWKSSYDDSHASYYYLVNIKCKQQRWEGISLTWIFLSLLEAYMGYIDSVIIVVIIFCFMPRLKNKHKNKVHK